MERIDKIIATGLNITRSEAKNLIKAKKVLKNGVVVKSANEKADELKDKLVANGREIVFEKFVYIMMNKPKGVISSTDGKKTNEKTVIDILPPEFKRKNLFPAGRLDKDTTGFMLVTNDGEFAHKILSPKNHVPKTYVATLNKPFGDDVVKGFENGVDLKNEKCMPAKIHSLNGDKLQAVVEIKQGMYHQIKRMFAAFSIEVVELKRIKIGSLPLDENLAPGQCRFINSLELQQISQTK